MQLKARPETRAGQVQRRRRTGFWLLAGIAIVAAAAAISLIWFFTRPLVHERKDQVPVVTVTTSVVRTRPIRQVIKASGTVFAVDPIDVGSEVPGLRVVEVAVDEGDYVRKGQVLLRLNSSVLQAQLRREMANLARANANLKLARDTAARFGMLYKEGAISTQEAEQHTTNALVADAEVGQAKAAIQQLQAQIAQTVIRAPDDGLITRRNVRLGEISTIGGKPAGAQLGGSGQPIGVQPMFSMARKNRLEVRVEVSEVDLPRVRVGNAVRAVPVSSPRPVKAWVRMISPLVDAQSRLGTVYAELLPGSGLKQGMFARAEISAGEHSSPAIPSRAILSEPGSKVVFVLEGQRVRRQPVRPGNTSGAFTEVVSGVRTGQKVVVAGAGFLQDGDVVRVRE